MCTSLPFGFEDVVFDCIISLSLPFCLLSIRYINKGKSCSFGVPCVSLVIGGRMWDLIVSVPIIAYLFIF